ncbi:hypothetical protein OH76DRAFT_1483157 [Lentinus brumalis]|uniref:BTB domain-containing protein n=1 Tax=Lentinus brumalis TaxID=2498619 RepID=A0A371DAD8_9APHY|nr:hypothetical protein OH76DRAFT_1483157 [Polyporus brumalis]
MADSEDHLVPGASGCRAPIIPTSLSCLVENAARDKDYWFRDGNLILVTDLRRTAFRIYKDLLARQSGTFDDMFASSSPEVKEMYEGCPVVERSDAPEDLRHLLAVLLPTTFCRKKDDLLPSLYAFSAIIRLSHKYNIQHLEEQALDALKEHYCDTLNAYDERSSPASRTHLPCYPYEYVTVPARTDAFVDGWLREDGTVVRLSADDSRRCLRASYALARESFDCASKMVHLAGNTACTVDADCRESLIELYMAIDSHYLSAVDPLEGGERSWSWWVEHYEGYSEDKPPCEKCVERVREQEKTYHRRGWVWLPMCFNISVPGWPEWPGDAP